MRLLADDSFRAGMHAFEWDGVDARGRAAAPGIYFAKLARGGQQEMRKLVLEG